MYVMYIPFALVFVIRGCRRILSNDNPAWGSVTTGIGLAMLMASFIVLTSR